MGKKKSVVLLTLLTIVIAVLCAMIVVPSFDLPFLWNGAKSTWNPIVKTYDFGTDLGGGYYTYYYPEGIISETEFATGCENKTGDELAEYKESYTKHAGLYLSTDPDDGVVAQDKAADGSYVVSETFKTSFSDAVKAISARFEKKAYSSYRVSVVDDYAVKVELPACDTNASSVMNYFSYTGEFTLYDGTSTVFEETKDKVASDYFKSFSPKTNRDSAYVEVKLTDKGRALIKEVTTSLASSGSSSSSSSPTLSFKVGDQSVIQLTVSEAIDEKTLYIGGSSSYTYDTASTVAILLDSAVGAGDLGITFNVDTARTYEPAYGENAVTLLYIALAIILVAVIILPIIKYRGFGGAMAYSTLSYLIIAAFCFAFITSGVFEFTLGTVLIFLFGLLINLFFNMYSYKSIKGEFAAGKTIYASVKAGYKKTIAPIVDTYAVLILAAVGLLIGAAGLHTMALQALICFAAGAFCNLLWTRFINCMMLSAAKNKYKYFRFAREDDDDE